MTHEIVRTPSSREICVSVPGRDLIGILCLPSGAQGLVVLVHGSGSSRHAALDGNAAAALQAAGFGTVRIELLDEVEARDVHNLFDAELQAERLIEVVDALGADPATGSLPLGLLGAGTGAGTALLAAAKAPGRVAAIVSRGGHCDLAAFWLPRITAPTLLILGGNDASVLRCNKEAYRLIGVQKQLIVVPGAGHLFEEPGALDRASNCAAKWFKRHLHPGRAPAGRSASSGAPQRLARQPGNR
jgi:pimeloyl-ACP methyl ester carboxylesterase